MTGVLPLGGETPVIAASLRGGGFQAGSAARTAPVRGSNQKARRSSGLFTPSVELDNAQPD
jgi:hypothetical protein